MLPSLAQLEAAAALVHAVMPPTPQYCWPLLCRRAGAEVWVIPTNEELLIARDTVRCIVEAGG